MEEISGIVIAVEWDEQGNTAAVAIMAPDEKEYLVEKTEKGGELFSLIRQKVNVLCNIRKSPDKQNIIQVREYTRCPF